MCIRDSTHTHTHTHTHTKHVYNVITGLLSLTNCVYIHIMFVVFSIPLRIYGLLALLTLGTMGFSNSSLGYLNYPTQVIFKCCKLIPCLIGSIAIQQKKYGPIDYIAAVCLSVGLTLFTLADSKISPNFSIIG